MLHFHWLRSLREYTVVQVSTGALGGLRVPGGALGKAKAVADGSLGKWALACAMSKSLGCTPWCTPLLLLSRFGSALVLAAFASGGPFRRAVWTESLSLRTATRSAGRALRQAPLDHDSGRRHAYSTVVSMLFF